MQPTVPHMASQQPLQQRSGGPVGPLDLTGAEVADVRLTGGSVERVRIRDADIRDVLVAGGRIRGIELVDVDISGDLERVRINGVEVAPLIEAELARLHPEYGLLRPADAAGFRRAWPVLEELWASTVARARALEARDPDLLHESVDREWSFIETLRHLLFVTDAWVRRGILGDPSPWHPLDLLWDQMPDTPGTPRDRAARPSLDEVLALRADRAAGVRAFFASLTDGDLATTTAPVHAPGWPPAHAFPLAEPLHVLLNEEWWHRQYAERDLAVIEARLAGPDHAPATNEEER